MANTESSQPILPIFGSKFDNYRGNKMVSSHIFQMDIAGRSAGICNIPLACCQTKEPNQEYYQIDLCMIG